MVSKRSRLSRSTDFQRVYRQGSSTASRFLVLYFFKRSAETSASAPRMGLSVSKKLGGAVVRNRVKRLLREAFTACQGQLTQDYDVVFIARPQLIELIARQDRGEKGAVGAAVRELLGRAGLLVGDAAGDGDE
jgi:ribonuclease P protein component